MTLDHFTPRQYSLWYSVARSCSLTSRSVGKRLRHNHPSYVFLDYLPSICRLLAIDVMDQRTSDRLSVYPAHREAHAQP